MNTLIILNFQFGTVTGIAQHRWEDTGKTLFFIFENDKNVKILLAITQAGRRAMGTWSLRNLKEPK